jgi:hypothetical protein
MKQPQKTDIHTPGGNRIHKPSKRTAAKLRLRSRGHWDRPVPIISCIRIFEVLSKDTADVKVKSPDIQQKPKFIFLIIINKNTNGKIIYFTSGNVTNIPSTTSLTVSTPNQKRKNIMKEDFLDILKIF